VEPHKSRCRNAVNKIIKEICSHSVNNIYLVREKNPGGRIFRTRPDRPRAHPAPYTINTGLFPGINRLGYSINQSPPSSAEVKERIELSLYSVSVPHRML